MIGRAIWYAVLGAIAVVTVGLQLDRQSETTPALADKVPVPLRNHAQKQLALRAIETGGSDEALAEAKRLVERRPVPAEHLSLLALAEAKAGQQQQALMTIQMAAKRGWREPLAQEAVLRLALANGDMPEAARRYAALFLRDETPNRLLAELAPEVLGEPGGPGRRTMVDLISATERWHALVLRRGRLVMPPDAFREIVIASLARGAAFDCALLAQAIKGLRQKDDGEAVALAQGIAKACP